VFDRMSVESTTLRQDRLLGLPMRSATLNGPPTENGGKASFKMYERQARLGLTSALTILTHSSRHTN
jgi:hypothetical protein